MPAVKNKHKAQRLNNLDSVSNHLAHILKRNPEDCNPLLLAAECAAALFTGYTPLDSKGEPFIDDETGEEVFMPADKKSAVQAFIKIASYTNDSRTQEIDSKHGMNVKPQAVLTAQNIKSIREKLKLPESKKVTNILNMAAYQEKQEDAG